MSRLYWEMCGRQFPETIFTRLPVEDRVFSLRPGTSVVPATRDSSQTYYPRADERRTPSRPSPIPILMDRDGRMSHDSAQIHFVVN